MAKFRLSDIFIGNFPFTQAWGARPSVYSRWGMDGHNGWDWVMPNGTQIVTPADGECIKVAEEKNSQGELVGFGRYGKILHEQGGGYFVTVYAHLQSVEVAPGQKVKQGQLIAKADNNGFSEAPHLHFGVYLSDAQGNKIENNGFGGYHDPGDKDMFEWDIVNLEEPYVPSLEESSGISDDARRALDILEAFQKTEGHGNLEGAINALKGSHSDLEKIKSDLRKCQDSLGKRDEYIQSQNKTIITYKEQQEALAKDLGISPEFPAIKGEIHKLISVEDRTDALQRALNNLKEKEGKAIKAQRKEYEAKLKQKDEDYTTLKNKKDSDYEKLGDKVSELKQEISDLNSSQKEVNKDMDKIEILKIVWEGIKEPLRLVALAVVSFLITTGVNFIAKTLGGILDPNLILLITGVLTAALRTIDKILHNLGKQAGKPALIKGLTRF